MNGYNENRVINDIDRNFSNVMRIVGNHIIGRGFYSIPAAEEAVKIIKAESKNSIAKIITSSNEQRKYYERIIKSLESKIENNETCLFN